MTTYREIFGKSVKSIDTGPSPATTLEGSINYDTPSEQFKSATLTPGAWASGGNLNTGRYFINASTAGTQNAMLGFAGYGPGSSIHALTESYNGTSWSEVADLPVAKSRAGGTGTQAAALCFGGFSPAGPNTTFNTTEEWGGSSWTGTGNMNQARCYMGGFGTQTASVAAAGARLNPDLLYNVTEEYDGSTWTSGNAMPGFFVQQTGVGTLTAGIAMAGRKSPSSAYSGRSNTTATLEYDGTNWTAANSAPASAEGSGGSGGGTQSAAWMGGWPDKAVQHYDGTNYSTVESTATRQSSGGGGAVQSAGIIFGGIVDPPISNATEEYTGATITKRTLTTS